MDKIFHSDELVFVNGSTPALNAGNMNAICEGLSDLDDRVCTIGTLAETTLDNAQTAASNASASASAAAGSVTEAEAQVTLARGYAEQAHYYSDHAFSGTPEGYSQLVDDVYSLHTTENKDFGSVKGKIMPIRIDGKSEKTDSVIRSVGDYGLVDLGSLDWSINNASASAITFKTTLNGVKRTESSTTVISTALCIGYTATSGSTIGFATSGKMFAVSSASDTLYVCNPAFNGKSGTEVKALLSGTLLLYELATGSTSNQYGLGIKEHGKNLLKPTLASATTTNGITCTPLGDGTFKLNGTATANGISFTLASGINIPTNNTYILGSPVEYSSSAKVYMRVYFSDSTSFTSTQKAPKKVTDGKTIVTVNLMVDSGGVCNNLIVKPMITIDTTATYDSFVAYEKPTSVILPLSAPLRSVGTVKDTIEDGKIVRRVGCYTFTGSENLTNQTSTTNYKWYSATLPNCKNLGSVFSDAFLSTDFTYTSSTSDTLGAFLRYSDLYFSFPKSTTASSFVSGKSIIYELATSTTEELTPSQQKALCSLKSYDGHTYLEAVGLEPTMSVKYADYEVSALALEGYVEAKYNRALIEDNLATVQAMILELETES